MNASMWVYMMQNPAGVVYSMWLVLVESETPTLFWYVIPQEPVEMHNNEYPDADSAAADIGKIAEMLKEFGWDLVGYETYTLDATDERGIELGFCPSSVINHSTDNINDYFDFFFRDRSIS